ncbi:MAG: hypothetical protein QOG49_1066 [Frankiaceae bacterium]|nr:hypothetical protein [Frankiaceae bacterium]
MTRRPAAAGLIALLVAACGAHQAPVAAPATTQAATTQTATTPAATTPAATPAATSQAVSAAPAAPASTSSSASLSTSASSPVPSSAATAPSNGPPKQWAPEDHASVPARWPAQKCELPTTRDNVIPHFDTPVLAMAFLTRAYNCYDVVALKRVTVSAAREALLAMTAEATNLKLEECVANTQRHDFDCTFTHDLPPSAKGHDTNGDGVGRAWFVVAPAVRSGWYMTVLLDCGG